MKPVGQHEQVKVHTAITDAMRDGFIIDGALFGPFAPAEAFILPQISLAAATHPNHDWLQHPLQN